MRQLFAKAIGIRAFCTLALFLALDLFWGEGGREQLSYAAENSEEASLLQRYSMEELDSVALLLRVIVDSESSEKLDLSSCKLDQEGTLRLLQPLHYLIDLKLQEEKKRLPLRGERLKRARHCEKSCHCGIYSTLLEGAPKQQGLKRAMERKASRQSASESLKCAKGIRWFCGSPLLQYLEQ